MECIILAEQAGLRIDVVTTDGVTWNRAMWNMLGVTHEQISIEHIVDNKRRLWFVSDFPHVKKCIRNFFTNHSKYSEIYVRMN